MKMTELFSLNVYPVVFTHCMLVSSFTVIYWTSPLSFKQCQVYCVTYSIFGGKSCMPDQMPHHVASKLGLHC